MKWFIVSSQLGGWFTKSFHWADASCLIWVEKSGSRFRFLGVFKSRLSFVSSSTPRQVSKIGCGTARKKQTPRQETGEMTVKWETGEEQVSPWKTFSKFSRLLPGTRVSVGDFCFSAPTLRANKRGEREMRGEVELNAVTRNPVVPSVFDEKTVARSYWSFTLNSIKTHCFIGF